MEAYVGSFPNAFFYLNNPHSNVDVALSSLARSLGATLVHIPGVHSLSAYCSLPLGYLKWPLVATHTHVDEFGVTKHEDVLHFMLEGGGN